MITDKDILESNRELLEKYDKFIPASWKRVYAFLKGINNATEAQLNAIIDCEDEPSIDDIAEELFVDAFCTATQDIPTVLPDGRVPIYYDVDYDIEWKSLISALQCLQVVARSIQEEFRQAKEKFEQIAIDITSADNLNSLFFLLERECALVGNITSCCIQGSLNDLCKLAYKKLFTIQCSHKLPFEITEDTCINVLYHCHKDWKGNLVVEYKNGDDYDYYTYDNCSLKIVLNPYHGMSAYAFLVYYFNANNEIPRDWSNYAQISPHIWIDYYMNESLSNAEQTPIEATRAQLWRDFIGRPVFMELLEHSHLGQLLSAGFGKDEYSLKEQIAQRPIDEIKEIFRLAISETNYLLRNRTYISNCFVSETKYNDLKEFEDEARKMVYQMGEKIDAYFLGNNEIDDSILSTLQSFLINNRLGLFQQHPEAYSTKVLEKFDELISQNEAVKSFLREAIEEYNYSMSDEKTQSSTKLLEKMDELISQNEAVKRFLREAIEEYINSIPDEKTLSTNERKDDTNALAAIEEYNNSMPDETVQSTNEHKDDTNASRARLAAIDSGLVDQNGVRISSRSKLAKWLVEKEFVSRTYGWADIREGSIVNMIDELTRSLYWVGMNVFYERNVKTGDITQLTPQKLRKAFCDGDSLGGKRLELFKELVRKNKVKIK